MSLRMLESDLGDRVVQYACDCREYALPLGPALHVLAPIGGDEGRIEEDLFAAHLALRHAHQMPSASSLARMLTERYGYVMVSCDEPGYYVHPPMPRDDLVSNDRLL